MSSEPAVTGTPRLCGASVSRKPLGALRGRRLQLRNSAGQQRPAGFTAWEGEREGAAPVEPSHSHCRGADTNTADFIVDLCEAKRRPSETRVGGSHRLANL
ncbi:unnamed protein product [Lampetra fluviatilis]